MCRPPDDVRRPLSVAHQILCGRPFYRHRGHLDCTSAPVPAHDRGHRCAVCRKHDRGPCWRLQGAARRGCALRRHHHAASPPYHVCRLAALGAQPGQATGTLRAYLSRTGDRSWSRGRSRCSIVRSAGARLSLRGSLSASAERGFSRYCRFAGAGMSRPTSFGEPCDGPGSSSSSGSLNPSPRCSGCGACCALARCKPGSRGTHCEPPHPQSLQRMRTKAVCGRSNLLQAVGRLREHLAARRSLGTLAQERVTDLAAPLDILRRFLSAALNDSN